MFAVVGVPQPGAALLGMQALPRPMLVPPGMGVEGAAASPSPAGGWTEHKHEDGRVYYYNTVSYIQFIVSYESFDWLSS